MKPSSTSEAHELTGKFKVIEKITQEWGTAKGFECEDFDNSDIEQMLEEAYVKGQEAAVAAMKQVLLAIEEDLDY